MVIHNATPTCGMRTHEGCNNTQPWQQATGRHRRTELRGVVHGMYVYWVAGGLFGTALGRA